MRTDPEISPWRQDSLSQLGNLLAFFERLAREVAVQPREPITVLYLDLADLTRLNHRRGNKVGDQALRWLALAMRDELPDDACFRLRGDEFAAILGGEPDAVRAAALRVRQRFHRLTHTDLPATPVEEPLYLVLLHLPAAIPIEVADVLIAMESVMQRLKQQGMHLAEASYPVHNEADLRATVSSLVDRVMELGAMLDRATQEAESDPLTGLPNMRAMARHLAETLAESRAGEGHFALLLVDGDNLRAINKISYAAGDAMIRQLATLLGDELRHDDHLARWRLGDEFLILLPGADAEEAQRVGERLVERVQSGDWQMPVTISVGVALFPEHGSEADTLIAAVEEALNRAKEEGKNRALLYD